MGRKYAAVLGPLAMTVVILRAVKDRVGVESALWSAVLSMAGFALVGWILGTLAEAAVRDWVQMWFQAEFASEDAPSEEGAST